MRSHKLAMTSVAYAVTLLTVAAVTGLEFSTASKAEAVARPLPLEQNTPAGLLAIERRTNPPFMDQEQSVTAAKAKTEAQAKAKAVTKSASLVASQINPLAQYRGLTVPLTGRQLSHLLYHIGFRGDSHRLAWGIVMRESNARPRAHNDNHRTSDNSYGIFQINMYGSLGADRRGRYNLEDNSELFDPVTNARIAFNMSGGDDFGAWGVGKNAYKPGAGESTLKLDGYPGVVVTLSK